MKQLIQRWVDGIRRRERKQIIEQLYELSRNARSNGYDEQAQGIYEAADILQEELNK